MPLDFQQVNVKDIIVLPGRVRTPDRYEVTWKGRDRLKLESQLTKGQFRLLTDMQFNNAGFEEI